MKGIALPMALARSASVIAIAAGLAAVPGVAAAQAAQADAPQTAQVDDPSQAEDIVVTGVRASLERSIEIKRNSFGVVDAISAEDIGKFPDTNLAESLQRITGVSIDRVNGEGSTVTVRGFGSQYNLVTLNGRQLATSRIVAVGGDQGGDGAAGNSRSFDFSNLASEGVKTLEVYKTGRAAIPSGGIGAAINIVSRRPLDAQDSGFNGSIGAKASYDTSADDCIDCGSKITPEVSGLLSWSDKDQRFGVSVFGSYQKRNFSFPSQANDAWNIRTLADFLNPDNGFVRPSTKINNAPADPNTLVSVPNDSRYHYSEASRERINGQAVLQFKPTDTLMLTVDGLYAQERESERRSTQSNWFNRPFDEVTFDDADDGIATTRYLHETINGVKDAAFEQAYRAQKNRLWDIGANARWEVSDRLSFSLDGHIGKAESLPDNPNGQTSTTVAFNAPVVTSQSLDWGTDGFPRQKITFNDATPSTTPAGVPFIKGNANGVIDVGDLSSAVQRQFNSRQTQRIKEIRLDGTWDLGGGSQFDFGGNYRTTNTRQAQFNTTQTLGDWGNALPPDIESLAPGQVFQFCNVCNFHHNDPDADANTMIAFRTQNAAKLYNTLYDYYINLPYDPATGVSADGVNHRNRIDTNNDNRVKEDIWAVYGQVTWKGEIGGAKASLVAGVRFESTKVRATSLQTVPLAIVWTADNDFQINQSADQEALSSQGRYNNLLPSMDFQVEIARNLIGRLSYSKTIARAPYGNLFASTSVGAPPRATVIGGVAPGFQNNADLDPLTSDNFDVSLEWYYKRDSFISVGFFDKRVHNFIGNTLVDQNLFGLRDPTSGQPGTRSGTAREIVQGLQADMSDVNLFTATALVVKHNGDVGAATSEFQSHYNTATRALDQAFVDNILATYNITADANDPLFNFSVNTPINNKDAEIWGVEIAGQHFFGDTGIGIAASYTLVRGNVGIDTAADPDVDQFALVGLSDTANATLIYDKYGISARLAYNWRDKFLSATNRDTYHNPVFTAPYGQLDLNISYDVTPQLAVTFEGINLLEEGVRMYGRDKINTWFESEGSARYLIGARYRF
ncbi:TonB-dependent receptor [Sphingomonas sp. DT-204]|uniref:TonB-dependent receptor n=1 Tax=Sphingomonas sp. DT-204 TaxID=3396166 RepID=UPI003F1B7B2E